MVMKAADAGAVEHLRHQGHPLHLGSLPVVLTFVLLLDFDGLSKGVTHQKRSQRSGERVMQRGEALFIDEREVCARAQPLQGTMCKEEPA